MAQYRIDTSMNDAPYQGIHIFNGNKHILTFGEDDAPVPDFNTAQHMRAQTMIEYLNRVENVYISPEVMLDCFRHAKFVKPHERIRI